MKNIFAALTMIACFVSTAEAEKPNFVATFLNNDNIATKAGLTKLTGAELKVLNGVMNVAYDTGFKGPDLPDGKYEMMAILEKDDFLVKQLGLTKLTQIEKNNWDALFTQLYVTGHNKAKGNAAQNRQQQPPASPSAPAPAPQPSKVTIEPLYTWDVTVHIGRKYWATKDKYELYSSLTTEVQAKTRSEAVRIAASKSYTTNSALFGSRIEVAPAGTEGAKFRVYNCEATRQ